MVSKKTYGKKDKRNAVILFAAIHASFLAILLLPLYWYWNIISARLPMLALILCLTAYLLFTAWKLMLAMAKAIQGLPERQD